MKLDFDVVIVGASFSGLTLAHHLPGHLRTLVIDVKPATLHTVESTGLITVRTREVAKRCWGNSGASYEIYEIAGR